VAQIGHTRIDDLSESYINQVVRASEDFDSKSIRRGIDYNLIRNAFVRLSAVMSLSFIEMIRSYTDEYNRQWSITSALDPEYSFVRPLSISLPHIVRMDVVTTEDSLINHTFDYPRVRVLRPYERVPIVFQPDPLPPTPRVTVIHDPNAERDHRCRLGLASVKLGALYKNKYAACNGTWNGVNLKEEWLGKSEAVPALYSEAKLVSVTDFVHHRDFLKRRRENEW